MLCVNRKPRRMKKMPKRIQKLYPLKTKKKKQYLRTEKWTGIKDKIS